MENKRGFTLVELLAVIAILAILVIIALPNVINMYTTAKKNSFVTEAQGIAKNVASKFMSENMNGNHINVISNEKNPLDMSGEKLEYNFELDSQGKIKSMWVFNGTYCISTDKDYTQITKDDISEGKCKKIVKSNSPEPIYCTYSGELKSGVEYTNGQYTYSYMQEAYPDRGKVLWKTINYDGWGVKLTDKDNTEPVTTKLGTYINGKPILSLAHTFLYSKPTSIDLSSFNTTNVISMEGMFYGSPVTQLDLSNFDTGNVTNMAGMFYATNLEKINVSNFLTGKVKNMSSMFQDDNYLIEIEGLNNFDTTNVTDMSQMFMNSIATKLDLSSFDTSNVTNMYMMFGGVTAQILDLSNFNISDSTNIRGMFIGATSTIGYAKDAKTVNMFNNSSETSIPDTLKFTVKQ